MYVVFPLVPYTGCVASIQTYNITKSGDLTFNGATATGDYGANGLFQAPTILENDTFAYAAGIFYSGNLISGFILGSNGEMQNWSFNMSVPTAPSGGAGYLPLYVTADPTNHLAAMFSNSTPLTGTVAFQLASYTVDGQGNLSTTSTAENMPYPGVMRNDITTPIMNISPSGHLLAVGGLYGLQVFRFNGSNPITPYSLGQ